MRSSRYSLTRSQLSERLDARPLEIGTFETNDVQNGSQ